MILGTKRSPGTATEGHPLCLHVYRIGSIWGDDRIVRTDDRKTPRYYLKVTRYTANWQSALHVGGPNGFLICNIKSPYLGPPIRDVTDPSPISITIGLERHTVEVHHGKGFFDATYSFNGLDDKVYRWQPSSWSWGSKLKCTNSQDQVVATYRLTLFAISKDGELRIHEHVQFMADLLVATCLAIRTPDH
ncbi:hypothetical protein HD554DRAFT_1022262 [Boletus coccyginus]|nr:hypothetical protein HD554DRAFT_1022262 [Boletus coccyginus]